MDHNKPGIAFTSTTNIVDRMLREPSKPRLAPIGPLSQEEMLRNLKLHEPDCSAQERAIASLEEDNGILESHLVRRLAEHNL